MTHYTGGVEIVGAMLSVNSPYDSGKKGEFTDNIVLEICIALLV